ncbi:MAG: ornithine cyclodeaminase family protein, partial [Planctomycetia bacterium]|nr:ornithine cyclodeaminase family protein [Planctomycetia bacterium]
MPMPVLLLSEEDVRQVLTMELALPAVEDCLRQLAREEAQNIPRARTQSERVTLHVLSAASRK